MFNYWLGMLGTGVVLYVLRIPITFLVFMNGMYISDWLNWETPYRFFENQLYKFPFYHREWMPFHFMSEEQKKDINECIDEYEEEDR